MNNVKKCAVALLLAFAVSTTSVSCVQLPVCPNTGSPAVAC